MTDIYTCDRCGETYISGWSEAEAVAEAESRGLVIPGDDIGVLCEDCYQEFLTWARSQGYVS